MAKSTRIRNGAVAKVKTQHGDQNSVPEGSVDLSKIAGDVLARLLPTGSRIGFVGTTAPTGWVLASGRTLGNALSGATERASEDARALFTLLWNSYANTELAVSGGRGVSADADFDANKTIALPSYKDRTAVGRGDMGGTPANLITVAASGIDTSDMGASGGVQNVTLTAAQSGLPAHDHTISVTNSSNGNAAGSVLATGVAHVNHTGLVTGITLSQPSSNASSSHTNLQPLIVETVIIKL